jgi:hypothetical protein
MTREAHNLAAIVWSRQFICQRKWAKLIAGMQTALPPAFPKGRLI